MSFVQIRLVLSWRNVVLVGTVVGLVSLSYMYIARQAVYASSAVVINELMYNPATDNQADEFIELYNNSASGVDISGWCFTDGISGCFSPGTTIEPNGFIVASPNAGQTQATYGIEPDLIYQGQLSNRGERVRLSDASGVTVSSVTYDDMWPWAPSPDATGPSLERIDPLNDASLPASWAASIPDGGSPGQANSVFNLQTPVISDTSQHQDVQSTEEITVTVNVTNAIGVTLEYVVLFETPQTIVMLDDGNSGDGVAGDNVFGATIPTQADGTLVRYRIVATNDEGTTNSPGRNDTVNYYGYVVGKSSEPSETELLWFIDEDDYQLLLDAPTEDRTYYYSVLYVDGKVVDNAKARLKGEFSRTFDKKPFKINLPKGYSANLGGSLEYSLGEFHLNSEFSDSNRYITSLLSWKSFEHAGFPVPQVEKVRLERNGSFAGAYTLAEKYDNEWLERFPEYEDDIIYEDWFEKQRPEDNNNLARDEWRQNVTDLTGQDRINYIYDSYNVPNIINFMAVQAVIRGQDWSAESNTFSIKDSETGRWSVLPWDLDLTFSNVGELFQPPVTGYGRMISPYDRTDPISEDSRFFANAIWDDPTLRAMYQRRVRTLIDELYQQDRISDWASQVFLENKPMIDEDFSEWFSEEDAAYFTDFRSAVSNAGLDPLDSNDAKFVYGFLNPHFDVNTFPDEITAVQPLTPANRIFKLLKDIDRQIGLYGTAYVAEELIPESQTQTNIILQTVKNTVASDIQYIELLNSSSEHIDISGWELVGPVTMTMPGGSVIPSNSSVRIVKDDQSHKAEYGAGIFVLGQFSGILPSTGPFTLTLRNNIGQTINQKSVLATSQLLTPSGENVGASRATSSDATTSLLNEFSVTGNATTKPNQDSNLQQTANQTPLVDEKSEDSSRMNEDSAITTFGLLIVGGVVLSAIACLWIVEVRKTISHAQW